MACFFPSQIISSEWLFFLKLLIDEPKTPGPVELEQTSKGKVVVSWAPSPDEELDDRLYYVVTQHDSTTRVWKTVADRLFTHTYMANNILPGTEYHFQIYAKNDMGLSDPSQSPTWGVNNNKGISKSSLLKLKFISLWLVLIWSELQFKLFFFFSLFLFASSNSFK